MTFLTVSILLSCAESRIIPQFYAKSSDVSKQLPQNAQIYSIQSEIKGILQFYASVLRITTHLSIRILPISYIAKKSSDEMNAILAAALAIIFAKGFWDFSESILS